MKNMTAKYKYSVFFSEEEQEFIGICEEFPSLSGFGSTNLEAIEEIQAVVKSAVEILEERGQKIPLPFHEREYKGKILLRIDPETHRHIAEEASRRKRSINQHLASIINKNLHRESMVDLVSLLSNQIMFLEDELHDLVNLNNYTLAFKNYPGICNKPTFEFPTEKQTLSLDLECEKDKLFVEA